MTSPKTNLTLQDQVRGWMAACFGPRISADRLERCDRFIEEALELVQSCNYPRERISALTEYVYNRPIGELTQEVGGAQVTLAALCDAYAVDMQGCAEAELARIWTKIDKIREKQATKPVGSALPVAAPTLSQERLKRAFDVAVNEIMKSEPGDSRAVSDLAVALASVSCGVDDEESWAIIDAARDVANGATDVRTE